MDHAEMKQIKKDLALMSDRIDKAMANKQINPKKLDQSEDKGYKASKEDKKKLLAASLRQTLTRA